MAAAARDPAFAAAYSSPPAEGSALLASMSKAAAGLYAQTGDFTILHMITATHAARIVAAAVPALATPAFFEAAWRSYITAYASTGAPPKMEAPPPADPTGWGALLAAARTSPNDHAVKLTYTCLRERQTHGGEVNAAAARRVLWPSEA
jgi:hypothetical protein